jgi:hypothetical protein
MTPPMDGRTPAPLSLDLYEVTMAQSYHAQGMNDLATFSQPLYPPSAARLGLLSGGWPG